MSEPLRRPSRMTAREFLEWEERQPARYEFQDGIVRFMAGGTQRHNRIKGNLFAALHGKLRGKRCAPFDSDLKVLTQTGQYYYPDVTIDCGAPDDASTEASEPTIIFEVLSKSTRDIDLKEKLPNYQATVSIREIIYLESDRAHLMIWRRDQTGAWVESEIARFDEPLELLEGAVSITLAEIYEGVMAG